MATKAKPSSVLVVRFSALGDVAITIPVLYSVCQAHPGTRFVMVTRQWAARLFIDRPANLEVVGVDLTTDYSGPWGMMRLAWQLRRRHKIDAVADLHSVLRSWIIDATMRLCGVKVARIDKGRADKRRLVKGKIRRQLTPTLERYADVFARLGLEHNDTFAGFNQATTAILPAKGYGDRWVAIAPFSQHRGKEYPLAQMEQVIARLLERDEVKIILFGGGNKEKKQLAAIAQRHPRTTSLAGIQHGFTDEYAILRQCDVMVSMDSANMHLASLTGTPVVSVWGATHPWCGFMGWHQDPQNAVQLDLPCRPCSIFGQEECRYDDYHCLRDLAPERIVDRVLAVLNSPPA